MSSTSTYRTPSIVCCYCNVVLIAADVELQLNTIRDSVTNISTNTSLAL